MQVLREERAADASRGGQTRPQTLSDKGKMLHFHGQPRAAGPRRSSGSRGSAAPRHIAGARAKVPLSLSLGARKGGKIVLLLIRHSWERERKRTRDSDPVTTGYGEPSSTVAPAAPRAGVHGLSSHGVGAARGRGDSARTPRPVGFPGSSIPARSASPPFPGTVSPGRSPSARILVEKMLLLKGQKTPS